MDMHVFRLVDKDRRMTVKESKPEQIQGYILIIDDTPGSLEILSAILSRHGYTVRGAPDGPTALTIAGTEAPDLILLDIRMPRMDGYEVCQRLKSDG
jgi:two-component system sensor histidine kinase/response regulator